MKLLVITTPFMSIPTDKKYNQPIVKLNQPDDSYKIQPLPLPSGEYPYHLEAEKIVDLPRHKFSFHMVGDTGGMRYPHGQQKVAEQMCRQVSGTDAGEQPAFLYHLGDVVYHFGEAQHYNRQFFKPYAGYTNPVFAIAGNHDTDVNPAVPPYNSLDAFTTVFCNAERCTIPFNNASERKSMVQPNIYWTLKTPLANIIGLHSNVPKYGYIGAEQRNWFIEELKRANKERPGKCIIVTIHHAPYSADENHGSSLEMITFLEEAFTESGVRPDIIFSGHVHNYQRFNKAYDDGKILPFVVSGAGGFDELHDLVTVGDPQYSPDNALLHNVNLESYLVMKHGFLKITLERTATGVALTGEYYIVPGDGESNAIKMDSFKYVFK
ncbi:metallophosphoesterase family protein [Flavobacterium rhizosphaerae]|uniref:Metallophosphoesterase n=1 Tax=Flavobacterium rhizosphaerae TaxID=3163298 RepID=A0ABW8Z1W6_9FLAO